MTTVTIEEPVSNPVSATEEQATVTTKDDSSSEEVSGNAFPGATTAEQKTIDELRDSEARLVALAEQTLDPRDMLKKYAKLGGETVKVAKKRKASIRAGSWDKKDFGKTCSDLELLIKMRIPIKDVELDKYVRIHFFVEFMKPLVPNIEKMSYYQIKNKFLPTLEFDPIELTGEIRKGWLTWVRETIERQLGDEPLSMKELDAAIDAQKAVILKERNSKKTQEEMDLAERKAAEAKGRKERKDAQSKIADSIDKAIVDNHATPEDVAEIVGAVMRDHKVSMPKPKFNPDETTLADCKLIADGLFAASKFDEMRYLRDRLDAMVKIAENAMINTKTA